VPRPASGGGSPVADRIIQLVHHLQTRLDQGRIGQVIGPVLETHSER
jgi:hypothetical protein